MQTPKFKLPCLLHPDDISTNHLWDYTPIIPGEIKYVSENLVFQLDESHRVSLETLNGVLVASAEIELCKSGYINLYNISISSGFNFIDTVLWLIFSTKESTGRAVCVNDVHILNLVKTRAAEIHYMNVFNLSDEPLLFKYSACGFGMPLSISPEIFWYNFVNLKNGEYYAST